MSDAIDPLSAGEVGGQARSVNERPAVLLRPHGGYSVVRSAAGRDVAIADAEAMAERAALVRSLAEQLRAILRCHPDDLPLW